VDTLIGTRLGGYTLMRVLGSGGMGTVYLAEDTTIGQQVAIKVVRTDDADYPEATTVARAAERFRQEARAVASLDHLHILPLYRYGEEETVSGTRAYMVMQYRPEGSLWDWLRRRAGLASGESLAAAPRLPAHIPVSWPMSLEEVGEYVRQAASALQYAHDHGIVHRDVKPANFLLRFDANSANPDGEMRVFLLLSDFGLAKFFSSISATSHVFGTPMYMAPEQFDGAALPASDQYALAVMIYYFLAGRPPFEGDPMQLMHRHLSVEPPPIRAFVPTLPQGIESVLVRALAKNPQERFPTIMAFADAFTQQMREVSRPASPLFSLPPRPQEARQKLSSYLPPLNPSDTAGGNNKPATDAGIFAAPLSPNPYASPTPTSDGLHSALTVQSAPSPQATPWVQQEFPTAMVRASNEATVYPLLASTTPAQDAFTPVQSWPSSPLPAPPSSPLQQQTYPAAPPTQGQEVKMGRRDALGWILGGTAVVALGAGVGVYFYVKHEPPGIKYILKGHTGEVTSVAWAPDGALLASASLDATVHLWAANSQQSSVVYRGHSAAVQTVAWRPDGSLLASGSRDKSVQVWTPGGIRTDLFANLGATVSTLAWEKGGVRLFAGTLGSGLHTFVLNSGAVKAPLQHTVIHALALSPNGNMLAIGYSDGILALLDLITRSSVISNTRFGVILSLQWSSDGTMLAVGSADNKASIINIQSQLITSLPHSAAVNGVAWEPAGSARLATVSADGVLRIWSPTGALVSTYKGQAGALSSVAWSASGLAAGAANTTILVFDVR
jgi:serine/threonine protein kinase